MEEFIACTKRELDKANEPGQEEYKESLIKETNDAINNIPDQIKRGIKLIYSYRVDEWAAAVVKSAMGVDRGIIIKNALKIMEEIEQKLSIKEIVENFEKQELSDDVANSVKRCVLTFSKNGYPFYEATHSPYWTLDECYYIKDVMWKNENYDESHEYVDVSESKQKVYSKIKRLQKLEENSIR